MKFVSPDKNFIALGLCSHTLKQADFIHIDPSGDLPKAFDRYGFDEEYPREDTSYGGTNDVIVSEMGKRWREGVNDFLSKRQKV